MVQVQRLIRRQSSGLGYTSRVVALHVPLLGAEVAVDLLVSRTNDPDRQSARDLASELLT